MKRWARFVKRAKDEEQRDRLNLAIVAANNHYAGLVQKLPTHLGKCWICQK